MDCATAVKLSLYLAFVEVLGEEWFKKEYPRLIVLGAQEPTKPPALGYWTSQKRTPIPGDIMEFNNPDGLPGYKGENSIYIGQFDEAKRLFAFPYGKGTQAEIEKWLNKNRVESPTRSASLDKTPRYIDYKQIPD
jgi:hypothetical protein